MRIYLIWYHDESGPEELQGTLDKSKIVPMVEAIDWIKEDRPGVDKQKVVLERVKAAIDRDEIGIYPCHSGWGGIHVQIIEAVE